jgi:hypothetical protein
VATTFYSLIICIGTICSISGTSVVEGFLGQTLKFLKRIKAEGVSIAIVDIDGHLTDLETNEEIEHWLYRDGGRPKTVSKVVAPAHHGADITDTDEKDGCAENPDGDCEKSMSETGAHARDLAEPKTDLKLEYDVNSDSGREEIFLEVRTSPVVGHIVPEAGEGNERVVDRENSTLDSTL